VVEAAAGYRAGSLSLIMDSIHNFSDELALVALYLAFILSQGVSRHLLRTANIFNSVGLIAISGVLLWQAAERLIQPAPVQGTIVILTGLLAAGANWGVARLLIKPGQNNAAIRLAYVHNIGDVWVSLAPVAAGLLLSLTGYYFFDPLIAGGIAVWFMVSTGREVLAASSMPNKALSETGGSIVGPLVQTITRAALGASTLVASATAEQTQRRGVHLQHGRLSLMLAEFQRSNSRVETA
jgi:Co/Zn/Cd efflux system component